MRKCLQHVVLGLDGTAFEKMEMHNAVMAEIDGHLRKTFLPK